MSTVARILIAASSLVTLASSCSSSGWVHEGALRNSLGPDVVLLPVERVSQESRSACGLACLTAFLRYHNVPLDEEASRRFGSSEVEEIGIPAGELRDYLKSRDFRVALLRGSLSAEHPAGLLGLLKRGIPVIVQLALPGELSGTTLHYVLAVGYQPTRNWVLVMDPLRGVGAMTYRAFEESWAAANHLMLVAARTEEGTLSAGEPSFARSLSGTVATFAFDGPPERKRVTYWP